MVLLICLCEMAGTWVKAKHVVIENSLGYALVLSCMCFFKSNVYLHVIVLT